MKSLEISNVIELSTLRALYNQKSQMRLTGTDSDRVAQLVLGYETRLLENKPIIDHALEVVLVVDNEDNITSIAIESGNHRYFAALEAMEQGLIKGDYLIPIVHNSIVDDFNGFDIAVSFRTNDQKGWDENDTALVAYRISNGLSKIPLELKYTEPFPSKGITIEKDASKNSISVKGPEIPLYGNIKSVVLYNEKEESRTTATISKKGNNTSLPIAQTAIFMSKFGSLPSHMEITTLSYDDSKPGNMDKIFNYVGFKNSQAAYNQTYLSRYDILHNFAHTPMRGVDTVGTDAHWRLLDELKPDNRLNIELTRFNFINALKFVSKKEIKAIQSLTFILSQYVYNSFLNREGLRLNTKETPLFKKGTSLKIGGVEYHNVFKLAYLAKFAKDSEKTYNTFAELESDVKAAESARIAEDKAKEAAAAAEALKAAKEQDNARLQEIESLLKGKELSEVLSDEALKNLHKEKQHLISKNTDPSKDGQGNGSKDAFEDEKTTSKAEVKPAITGAVDSEAYKRKVYENVNIFAVKNSLNDAFVSFIMCVANDIDKLPVTLTNNEAIKNFLNALKK